VAARPTDDQLPARVRDVAEPLAVELDVDLIDVEVKGQKGRRVVKLIADHADVGSALDVDVIASLSRKVGSVLDEQDLVAGAYTLEVTSPGATRPLRRGRDFARNVGREVDIVRNETADGPAQVRGEVVAADDDTVTLRIDGAEQRLPLAEVDHGVVVLPW
jgi:ribosome maturation factor RimP